MYILQHIKLLTWTKVNRGVTLTICWIGLRASQQKVKHHKRRLNFSFICVMHYIFSNLWVENRILNKFKKLICVDIVTCQVKFCLLLYFLHIILFLTILASTGEQALSQKRRIGCPNPKASGLEVVTARRYRDAMCVRHNVLWMTSTLY